MQKVLRLVAGLMGRNNTTTLYARSTNSTTKEWKN